MISSSTCVKWSTLELPPVPLVPNAGAHLLPKAGAERTLEAVRCSPMLGPGPAHG